MGAHGHIMVTRPHTAHAHQVDVVELRPLGKARSSTHERKVVLRRDEAGALRQTDSACAPLTDKVENPSILCTLYFRREHAGAAAGAGGGVQGVGYDHGKMSGITDPRAAAGAGELCMWREGRAASPRDYSPWRPQIVHRR